MGRRPCVQLRCGKAPRRGCVLSRRPRRPSHIQVGLDYGSARGGGARPAEGGVVDDLNLRWGVGLRGGLRRHGLRRAQSGEKEGLTRGETHAEIRTATDSSLSSSLPLRGAHRSRVGGPSQTFEHWGGLALPRCSRVGPVLAGSRAENQERRATPGFSSKGEWDGRRSTGDGQLRPSRRRALLPRASTFAQATALLSRPVARTDPPRGHVTGVSVLLATSNRG